MKNILSICAVALMILSLASCANNSADSFQSKVDLLVNDKLDTERESLAATCDENMATAIAARVDAAKAKKRAAASKPKSISAGTTTTTTTPVYVPPAQTYVPPATTTTTTTTTTQQPKTVVESVKDKIKGKAGGSNTTGSSSGVSESKIETAKDKIRGKLKRN